MLKALRISASLALVAPVFGNFLGGLVQPVLIRREADNFNRGEPLRCVWRRVAQGSQLPRRHQNLNVVLREPEDSRRGSHVESRRNILRSPFQFMSNDVMQAVMATWAAKDIPARLDVAATARILGDRKSVV